MYPLTQAHQNVTTLHQQKISLPEQEERITPKNAHNKPTLINTTLERILSGNTFVNITARKRITVNSDINIKDSSHLILWSENDNSSGVDIKGNITSTTGGSLTIYSSGWIDIHKNITLNSGLLNITTKQGDIAFEKGITQPLQVKGLLPQAMVKVLGLKTPP